MSLRVGKIAEDFVQRFLEKCGFAVVRNTAKKRGDLALWDLEASAFGRTFRLEVKWDILAEQTGNLAVEYWNTKSGKPSGISVTTADIWVVLVGQPKAAYAAKTSLLKEFCELVRPVKLITNGGYHNAALKLYPADEILGAVFRPLREESLWELLGSV
jgi:hypothetical protein